MQNKTFYAQILTPDGALFEGEVEGVQVPGTGGNFEMLYNHAPIVSSLGIGKVLIKKADSSEQSYAVSGGFVEMSNNSLTLLAEKAEKAEDIDKEEAKRKAAETKARLKEITSGREELERELAIAKNKIDIAP